MTWIRIDDNFPQHSKVRPLSDLAFRLHVTAMCAVHVTNGLIDERTAQTLVVAPKAKVAAAIRELTTVPLGFGSGLWEEVQGGYAVHDYHEYNPTREESEAAKAKRTAARSEAGRKGAASRWQPDGKRDSKTMANDSPVPIPSPSPSPDSPLPPVDESATVQGAGEKKTSPRQTRITDEFIEELVTEFAPKLGGEQSVREIIGRALNHKASTKWIDKRRGLRDWLARDAESRPANGNGHNGRGVTAPPIDDDEKWAREAERWNR